MLHLYLEEEILEGCSLIRLNDHLVKILHHQILQENRVYQNLKMDYLKIPHLHHQLMSLLKKLYYYVNHLVVVH